MLKVDSVILQSNILTLPNMCFLLKLCVHLFVHFMNKETALP